LLVRRRLGGDRPRHRDRIDRARPERARRRAPRHLRPAAAPLLRVAVSAERTATATSTLLEVEGLTTQIRQRRGWVTAVDAISFGVGRGEILGLVGESGCGKTMTALSLMRLLPAAARVSGGRASLDGRDPLSLSPGRMRQ